MNFSIHNFSKKFGGIHALNDISFDFKKGMIVGLLGPNGSGKTTLINTITGIIPNNSGYVVIGKSRFSKIPIIKLHALKISRTFQHVRICEQMTVEENLMLACISRSVCMSFYKTQADYRAQVRSALQQCGLEGKKDDLARTLSYGQKKLLEIARALLTEPDFLLLDEPFAGLFPHMIDIIADELKRTKNVGCSILLIEHNMQIIRDICDEVIVLDAGKILAQGKTQEVLSKREVLEAYLGA